MATAKAKAKANTNTEQKVAQQAPQNGDTAAAKQPQKSAEADTHPVRTLMPIFHNDEWIAEGEVLEMSEADYTHLFRCGAVVLESE